MKKKGIIHLKKKKKSKIKVRYILEEEKLNELSHENEYLSEVQKLKENENYNNLFNKWEVKIKELKNNFRERKKLKYDINKYEE